MNDIDSIRRRMFDGTPADGDIAWCKQRLKALRNWPDTLSVEQEQELDTLVRWVKEHG